jgi:hypothetical protein
MSQIKLIVTMKSFLFLVFLLLFSTSAFAVDCFSASPSIEAGRGAYDEIIPRELEEGEHEALEELLQGLDGKWEGTAEVLDCKGTVEEPIEETEEYLIRSVVKMSRTGAFGLESTLTSEEKRTKQDEIIRLHLSKKMLATQDNKAVSDLELISVSSDELVYLRKSVSGNPRRVIERLTTIQKSGDSSFVVEAQVYLQGGLKSVSIWNLEKN